MPDVPEDGPGARPRSLTPARAAPLSARDDEVRLALSTLKHNHLLAHTGEPALRALIP